MRQSNFVIDTKTEQKLPDTKTEQKLPDADGEFWASNENIWTLRREEYINMQDFQQTMTGDPIVMENVETLVLALSHRSHDGLCEELDGLGAPVHIIGDALTPRTAEEAVLEGLKVGSSL